MTVGKAYPPNVTVEGAAYLVVGGLAYLLGTIG